VSLNLYSEPVECLREAAGNFERAPIEEFVEVPTVEMVARRLVKKASLSLSTCPGRNAERRVARLAQLQSSGNPHGCSAR
jgi:hypothetical protein